MIDWSIALASLKAAQSAADKYSDLPLKQALIDAYSGILQTKEQSLSLQEDLHAARKRVMDLEQLLAAKTADPRDGLNFDRGVWWAGDSREVSPDGPFCPKCLDDEGRRRILHRVGRQDHGQCLNCEKWYQVWPEDTRPPQRQGRSGWLGY